MAWHSLDGSATTDGLSQLGGFEQSSFATSEGVFVTWVDTRNGNSEIYVAFREHATGGWTQIGQSANGGGVSDDVVASRRPSVVRTGEEILVSWTSINANGTRSVELAAWDLSLPIPVWQRLPGVTNADHSQLQPYVQGALLGFMDATTGAVGASQFVSCDNSLQPGMTIYAGAATDRPLAFDLATLDGAAVAAVVTGESVGDEIHVVVSMGTTTGTYNCGGFTIDLEALQGWTPSATFSGGYIDSPAVELGDLEKHVVDLGQNEKRTEYGADVYVAWDMETDYENQVVGHYADFEIADPLATWQPLTSEFENTLLADTVSVSETIGYAAKPDLAASKSDVFITWMDDSVHQPRARNTTAIYVMEAPMKTTQFLEDAPGEANGRGVSANGGILQDLSITINDNELSETGKQHSPYISWTDAYTGEQQVYVRQHVESPGNSLPGFPRTPRPSSESVRAGDWQYSSIRIQ